MAFLCRSVIMTDKKGRGLVGFSLKRGGKSLNEWKMEPSEQREQSIKFA